MVLWLDSQLSVVRSCSTFGVHSTAAPMDPWDGLIQLFWFTPWIFRGLSLITLHKQGGNICKVDCVEILHLLDHADSEKSFYEPGARFVGCWGWGGISFLFLWPDRLCCDVQAFSRSILELNYLLDLFISSWNVFFSFFPRLVSVSIKSGLKSCQCFSR